MQIEEGFRDLKSTRHGFAFRHNLGRNPKRIAVLLLLAALATLALWILGLFAYQSGLNRKFQANTVRNKNVLSVIFLGQRLFERNHSLTWAQMKAAIEDVQQRVVDQLEDF